MRHRWTNGLWAMVFIGCSTFSGDDSVGDPDASTASSNDAGPGDGGVVAAPVCGNTVCDAPPEPTCIDDSSYQSFTASCVDDACQYDPKPIPCPESTACVDGACIDTRARLSGLEVSPGKLSFDPERMQYTVTVPADTLSVTITAKVADAKTSSVSIDGGASSVTSSVTSSAAFAPGSKARQVPIRVDSSYGSTTTYSILFLYEGEQAAFASSLKRTVFGYAAAVSSDGSTVAAVESTGTSDGGGLFMIFRRLPTGSWKEVSKQSLPTNNSGNPPAVVSISGDGKRIAIGLPGDGYENTPQGPKYVGTVRIYAEDNNHHWGEEFKLGATPLVKSDQFGKAAAMSEDGTTVVVGAEDGNAVYVFRRSPNGSWSQEAHLLPSGPYAVWFGAGVAISNNGTVAVGVPGEESSATGINGSKSNGGSQSSGAVYTFRRDAAGTWKEQAYIKASNAGSGDQFGYRVALSSDGSTLAVSAPRESSHAVGVGGDETSNDAEEAGAVYVFQSTNGGSWTQTAYIKASNAGWGDQFGDAVTLSSDGSVLGVGAPGEASSATGINGVQNDNTVAYSGAAYVFRRTGGSSWSQTAYVKPSINAPSAYFGRAISTSNDGSTLAVGAPYPFEPTLTDKGRVFIFAL